MGNTSTPTTTQILSEFNSWAAFKTFVLVNEAYAGGTNFKFTSSLKTYQTDEYISYNEKNCPIVKLRNYCSFYVCSNDENGIDVEELNRRWFIPKVREAHWGKENFDEFFAWLNNGGYEAILYDALNYGDYFDENGPVMKTKRMQQMAESSLSETQRVLKELTVDVMGGEDEDGNPGDPKEFWITIEDMQTYAEKSLNGKKPNNWETAGHSIQFLQKNRWGYLSPTQDEFNGLRADEIESGKRKRRSCMMTPALYGRLLKEKIAHGDKAKYQDLLRGRRKKIEELINSNF